MFCLDASALLTSWYDDYPPDIFPGLWRKLEENADKFLIIEPIFKEINPISNSEWNKLSSDQKEINYPVRNWIINNSFQILKMDDESKLISLNLESKYQIRTVGKGVKQVDLNLIAYSKNHNHHVITSESRQKSRPNEKYKYKIPLVCQDENVACSAFVELLRELRIAI